MAKHKKKKVRRVEAKGHATFTRIPVMHPIAASIRNTFLPTAGLLMALNPGAVFAGPEGGTIAGGQGNINTPNANTTVINQQSHNLSIDWQSFDVNANELVKFNQPSKAATALNRIHSQSASQIFGSIQANGNVLLVNPNGVFFKPGSSVNVNSLTASTLDISTNDFMNGKMDFKGVDGTDGIVVNQGVLEAATGGSINLVGKAVKNEGVIIAQAGQVNLVAGNKVTMDFDGDGLMQFAVDEEVIDNAQSLDAAVQNTGDIIADGGSVLLKGSAAKDVFTKVVNNSGVIKAGRIENKGGEIRLVGMGAGSSVLNTGTLNVAAVDSSSDGGSVEINADNVTNSGTITANATEGNAGSIHIDSVDTTLITEDGVVSATSSSAQGGQIHLLGDKVGLFDSATVDASGATGGGEVLIGGDVQGLNPDIKNASATFIAEDASVKSNATDNGDGGKIVVFAEDSTKIAGDLSATGGAVSGNGGFIETSGKASFQILNTPDVTAENGTAGHWLIDPYDINIDAGGGNTNINTTSPFDPTGNTASLGVDLITTALSGGATVTVTTGADGAQAGNITFNTSLDFNGTGTNTLILEAADNIDLNGNTISDSAGTDDVLNIRMIADANADDTGTITIDGAITTNNGTVDLIGEIIDISATVDAGSGNISLSEITSDAGTDTFLVGHDADLSEVSLNNLTTSGTVTFGVALDASGTAILSGKVNIDENPAGDGIVTFDSDFTGSIVFTGADGVELVESATFDAATTDITFNANAGTVVGTGPHTFVVDDTGTFTVAAGAALISGNNDVNINADDVDINATGSVNSGSGAITIFENAATVAGIGLGGTALGLNITGAELQNITTTGGADLNLLTSGSMTVNGITAANSANISGTTNLNVVGDVNFSTAASDFTNNLNVEADNNVTANVGVTVSTGTMLTVTADDDGSNVGAISGAGTLTATTIDLDAATGIAATTNATTITADNTTSGNVIINETDGVTISGTNTGGGTYNVTAGTAGTLIVGAGNIDANTGDVTLEADAMTFTGTVDGANVTLIRESAGDISLGAGTGLTLSDTALDQVLTSGTLTIGESGGNTTDIDVDAAIDHATADLELIGDGDITFQQGAVTGLTSTGRVTLNAGDEIIQQATVATDISAAEISLTAANRIGATGTTGAIETALTSGDLAAVSTNGGVFIRNTGGDLDITTVGALSNITATTTGDIEITNTAGSITLTDNVDASSTGKVILDASTNIIDGGGTIQMDNGGLLLQADTGVGVTGAGGQIEITGLVVDLAAQNTSSGGIYLNHATGLITIDDVMDTDGTTISGIDAQGTGDIGITTSALGIDILENITANDAAQIITLDASAGAIFRTVGTGTIEVADGGSVLLGAGTGIGTDANAILISNGASANNTNLAAASLSGDIHIDHTGGLTLDSVTGSSGFSLSTVNIAIGGVGEDIDISASSPLTVNVDVTQTGGGDITLSANGATAADDLTINANITASGGNGDINLYAGDDIEQTGATIIGVAGSGTVNVNAGVDFTTGVVAAGLADSGTFTQTGGAITSVDGVITVLGTEDIFINDIQSSNSDVRITADHNFALGLNDGTGEVSEVGGGDVGVDVIADAFEVLAATGVGDGNAIETTVTSIDINNTVSGNIEITETLNLVVTDAAQTADSDTADIIITATAGGIAIDTLTAGAGADGDVTLVATNVTNGEITDNDASATLNIIADVLTIDAGIGVGDGDAIETTVNSIDIDNSTSGNIEITETDGLTVTKADQAADSDTADIIIASTAGGIAIDTIEAGAGADGDVTLTATGAGGAITDVGAGVLITADALTIDAATGVGDGDALETSVNSLDIDNSTSGDIDISEADGVTITKAANAGANANDNVRVVTTGAGDMVVADVSAVGDGTAASIILTTNDGSILDDNDDGTTNISAGAANVAINLTAGGSNDIGGSGGAATFGVPANYLDISNTNLPDINVTISGSPDVYLNFLNGAVSSSQLNGTILGGGSVNSINLGVSNNAFTFNDNTFGVLASSNAYDFDLIATTINLNLDTAGAADIKTSGSVTLTATTGAVVDGTDATQAIDIVAGALTIDAATGVGSANAIETTVSSIDIDNSTSGNVNIIETDALDIANIDIAAGTGTVSVTAGGAIDVTAAGSGITTNDGTVTLTAAADDALLSVDSAIDTSTGGNNITLNADRMDFSASIDAGTGDVTLQEETVGDTGDAIHLGSATDVAGDTIELSDAELNLITADLLTIGDTANADAISIRANIFTAPNINTLHLKTTSTVSHANLVADGIKSGLDVAVTAGDDVDLGDAQNNFGTIAVTTGGTDSIVDIRDLNGFTVGSVDGVVGISTGDGQIDLHGIRTIDIQQQVTNTGSSAINITTVGTIGSTDVDLSTATADVNAGSGKITIDVAPGASGTDALIMASGASLTTTNTGDAIEVIADDLNINAAATISATTGQVTIRPQQASTNIDLGSGAAGTGIVLTDTELNTISAADVRIGDTTNTNIITVDGNFTSSATFATDLLTLAAAGNIVDLAAGALDLSAGGGTDLLLRSNGTVLLNSTGHDVETLAAVVGGANSFTFTDTDDLTVGSLTDDLGGPVNGITAASGVTVTAGAGGAGLLDVDQNISATDNDISLTGVGITLGDGSGNGDVIAGTGNITLDANAGTLTLSAMNEVLSTDTINAFADQYVIAADAQIGGTTGFASNAATVTLEATTLNTTMGIAGGAGTIQLDVAELARIRSTDVRLGDTVNTGSITVDTWTPGMDFATGVLTLATRGTISQSGGGIDLSTSGSDLILRTTALAAILNNAGNDFGNVAAVVGAAGTLNLRDASGLVIDTLTDDLGVVTGLSGASNISLIVDGGTTTQTAGSVISTAGSLTLSGSSAVTLTDTGNAVSTFRAVNTGSVSYRDMDALGTSNTTIITGGNLSIQTGDTLTIDHSIDTSVSTGGGVTLNADGTDADVAINAAITTDDGNVTITADDSVIFTAGSIGTTGASAGNGDVSITSNTNTSNGDTGDGIDMDAASSINAGAALITLDSTGTNAGNIDITGLTSTNAGNAISITTDAAVTDAEGAAGIDISATSGTLVIASSQGVGSGVGAEIETDVANLNVANNRGTAANNIQIIEADNVTLTTNFVNAATNGTMVLSTTDGSIDIGTVAVSTQDGAITFTAGDAGADNGSITVGANGIASNGAGAGNIILNAADGVALGGNVNASADDVTINADTGDADNAGAITRTAGTVTGGTIDLDAATGIVAVTAGSTISADNTTSGNVDIDNTLATAVSVTSLTTATAGADIFFDQLGAGNVSFTTITAPDDVTINSENGVTLNDVNSQDLTVNVDTAGGNASLLDLGNGTLTVTNTILLDGNGTDDTLRGNTQVNTWVITGANAGILNPGAPNFATFTDFRNISGDDSANTDTLDYSDASAVDASIAVVLTAAGTDDGLTGGSTGATSGLINFDNIDEVIGTSGTDSLTGFNTAAEFEVDGGNRYCVTNCAAPTNVLGFSAIEDLTGNAAVDTFNVTVAHTGDLDGAGQNDVFNFINIADTRLTGNVSGGAGNDTFNFGTPTGTPPGTSVYTITGSLDGGTGSDTIDYSGSSLAQILTITNSDANGSDGTILDDGLSATPPDTDLLTAGFADVESFIGNNQGTFVGPNADTFWDVTGTNVGTYGDSLANIADNAYANFGIVAGSFDDVFIFQNAGEVTGGISGGGGTNTLVGTSGDDTFAISGATSVSITTPGALTTSLTNIDHIDGTDATDTGADIFNINGNWAGNLFGVGGVDNFNLATGVVLAGTAAINGGAGSDILTETDGTNTIVLDATGLDGTYNAADIISVETLNGGTGSDTYNVQFLDTAITINAGGGADTFNVSSDAPTNTGSLDDITALLTVRGDGGADTLNVSDAGDADADTTGDLSATAITNIFGGGGSVNYSDGAANVVETIAVTLGDGNDEFTISATDALTTSLTINGHDGNDTINVESITAGTVTAVNGGAGDDIVNVGTAGNSLDNIGEALTINGNADATATGDTININDQGDADANDYTVSGTTIARTGIPTITYGTTENLNLNTGGGVNNIMATGWSSTNGTITDAGGADVFDVDAAFSVTGDFTINNVETIMDSGFRLGADGLIVSNASTSFVLDTTISSLTATGTNAAITIDESNGITLTNVLSTGDINIDAANVASGDITAVLVNANAGANNVTLNTLDNGGAVQGTAVGATDVTANLLTIDTTTGVGSVTALETAVVTADIVNTTSGSIHIVETNDLAVDTIANGTRAVTVQVGGALTDGGDGNVDFVAGGLTIDAVNGVGSGNALETTVTSIDIDNTTSNNIQIVETDSIAVTQLDNDAAAGAVSVNAGNTITVLDVGSGGVGVSALAGQITLDASTTAGAVVPVTTADVVINHTVANDGAGITISAKDSVSFSAAGAITSANAGNVIVTANADDVASAGNDEINMANGAVIDAGSGTITMSTGDAGAAPTGGDILLGRLVTTNGTGTAVSLTADGAVTDVGAAQTPVDVEATTGGLVILARDGVGGGNDIETTVASIDIINNTNGSVSIDETDNLNVLQVLNTAATGDEFTNIVSQTGTLNVTTIDAGAGESLLFAGAAITDANGGTNNITADDLILIADTGIDIDINATVLAASSESGDINIEDTAGGVSIGSSTNGVAGTTLSGITMIDALGNNSGNDDITVLVTGGALSVDQAVTNNDGGDISLTTTNGAGNDITINTNGQLVTNSTTTGLITVDSGDDIIANNTGFAQDIQGTGAIELRADANVNLNAAFAARNSTGDIDVIADDAAGNNGNVITMNDTAELISDNGTVDLTADGNITVGHVEATNSVSATAITATSTSGAIVDGGDTFVDFIAATGRLVINAVTGVGSGNDIDTTVASVDITNSTSGTIEIEETDSVSLITIDNGTRDINLNIGGAITDGDDGSVDIVAGRADIVATGGIGAVASTTGGANDAIEMTVTSIDAVNNTSGEIQIVETDDLIIDTIDNATRDVSITSTAGGLIDGGAASVDIIAGNATLSASTGIGNGAAVIVDGGGADDNPLELNVTSINATNTANAIQIEDTGDLQIDTIDSGGDVAVTVVGALIDGGDNNVDIVSGGTATLNAATGIGAVGTAVNADGGGVPADDALETTIVTVDATNSTSGEVQLDETNGVTLDQISNGTRNVVLTAGGLIDDDADAGAVDIIAGNAILTAGTGIGDTANAIETTITALAATTTSGDIAVLETDALNIENTGGVNGITVTGGTAGDDIDIRTTNGDINVNAQVSGGTTIGDVVSIRLDAGGVNAGDNADINIGAGLFDIENRDAAITLEADDSIVFSDALSSLLSIDAGDITLTANADGAAGNDGNQIDMFDSTSINSGQGKIILTTVGGGVGGNIDVANLRNNTTTAADMVSISTDAAVTDAGDAGLGTWPGSININAIDINTAGGIIIDAVTGIYNGDTLVVRANNIDVDNSTGTSTLNINNTANSAVTISSLTTVAGSIKYDQIGNQSLTINTLTTGDGGGAGAIDIDNAGGTNADIAIDSTAGLGVRADTVDDVVTIDTPGAISEGTADTNSDIQGFDVTLNAVEGIGATTANGAIEIISPTVTATNTTSGGIFINSLGGTSAGTGAVDFNSIQAQVAGNVELFSATDTDLTDIDSIAGSVQVMTSAGNILIGDIDAATSVQVDTNAGSINDLTAGDTVVTDITAGTTIDLDATTGIGDSEELELDATSIAADTTAGAIDLSNNNANPVAVTSLTTTGSDITFNQTGVGLTTFTTVTTTGAGGITLNAEDGIDIAGLVQTAGVDIDIDADTDSVGAGDFSLLGGGTLSTGAGAGDVNIRAADFNFLGTLITGLGSLNLTLSQNRSLCLGTITGCGINLNNTDLATIAASGAFSLSNNDFVLVENAVFNNDLTLGAVTTFDDTDNNADNYSSTGTLTITATGAIGSDPTASFLPIVTTSTDGVSVDVAGLTVTSTGGNDVTVNDSGTANGNTVYSVTTGGAGDVTVVQATNDILIDTINTTGDVDLTATAGSISDNNVADDTVANIVANNISLTALNGDVGATGILGDVDVTLGGTLDADTSTGTGGIFIEGTGALFLGTVQTDGANGDVELNAGGTITDAGALSTIADSLTIDAVGGVDLVTRALTFDVDNLTSGSIDIDNDTVTAAVNITKMNNAPAGTIDFTQTGNQSLTINDTDTSNGDITFSNTGGVNANILIGTGGGIVAGTAGNTVTVTSDGSINDAQANVETVTDITATIIDLDAETGIGDTADVDIDGTTVSVDTTAGAIDIESNASGAVTVTSLTTGGAGGAVTFNQTGNETLALTTVSTTDGDVTIGNSGGANTDVSIGAGGVTADQVNDTISITSSGGAISSTGTLTGANLTMNSGGAGAALGSTGTPIDTDITGNFNLTTNAGDIFISDANAHNSSDFVTSAGAGPQTVSLATAGAFTIDDNTFDNEDIIINAATINLNTATVNTVNTLTLNGDVTQNVSSNLVAATGPITLNGDLTAGAGLTLDVDVPTFQTNGNILMGDTGTLDMSGVTTLSVIGNTLLNANNIVFPGTVSGTSILAIDPSDTQAISIGLGNGTGNIPVASFTNFAGDLVIGGFMTTGATAADPLISDIAAIPAPGFIDISATTISIDQAFETDGSITLLAGQVDVNADITAGAPGGDGIGPGPDFINVSAVGDDGGNLPGATGNINVPGLVTIAAEQGVFVANGEINTPANLILDFTGGAVEVATSGGGVIAFGPGSTATGQPTATPGFNSYLALLGLSFNNFVATVSQVQILNPAADLIGLEELGFIDTGLFEQDLTLFGQIGTGIALALAQCEEIEGCAPNVTEEELNEFIAQIEARIEELIRRSNEARTPKEKEKLEELIAGFQEELQNFISYRQQLQEYLAIDEEEFDEEFDDEFSDDFDGAPDADGIRKLAKILVGVNKRIQWLESLKGDPEARAKLSQSTGIDLTQEALDQIIEAAKAEAQFIERQIKLLQEGTEAKLQSDPLFIAEAGDHSLTQIVNFGPSLLNIGDNKSGQGWY